MKYLMMVLMAFGFPVRPRPRTPLDLPNINLNCEKKQFFVKTNRFSYVGQICFVFLYLSDPYCLGGTKRRNSNSNSLFLGSKTGIRFDTKWHHNWPNQEISGRISIQIAVRVFFDFQKNGFRVFGTKKKNRWRITSVKKSKMTLFVFYDSLG